MNILIVHPGSNYATGDIYFGLARALQRKGHQVQPYALDKRLEDAKHYMSVSLAHAKQLYGEQRTIMPTNQDIMYFACQGMIERALFLDIDFVLVISGFLVNPLILGLLRKANIPVGMYFTESPYDDWAQIGFLPFVDIAWTNDKVGVANLKDDRVQARFLPPAYDPERHRPLPDAEMLHDVIFVGSAFPERIAFIEQMDWSGINVGFYGNWAYLAIDSELRPRVHNEPMINAKATELYQRSKIGLNFYRTSKILNSPGILEPGAYQGDAHTMNPRAVELAACGVFTISNHRDHVKEVFGDLLPTAESPKEMENLIRFYLENEEERKSIASQLPGKVAGMSFDHMADVVLSDCSALLGLV